MTATITNYVWCDDCRCSVHHWETYAWHVDQGHRLIWPSQRDAR